MNIKKHLATSAAVIGAAALPSIAAQVPLKGTFALPDVTEKVTAELVVTRRRVSPSRSSTRN